ncbi:MAG: antibiotic biosynthesis monooxygenase [Candidatus Azobacteroides sp.]|nr:antibiotic biosynthesis monooxygenase [Candidatus Azobacteroides sp.]
MRKKLSIFLTGCLLFSSAFCQEKTEREEENNIEKDLSSSTSGKNKVRLALIIVDPAQLERYNAFLKEEIEASMRLEPGVLALYAMSEKEHPNRITILEIYADEEAYQSHIQTPHFITYKEGTANIVQSLELIETIPLIPELKIKESIK